MFACQDQLRRETVQALQATPRGWDVWDVSKQADLNGIDGVCLMGYKGYACKNK